jgi:hypothetical protein
MVSAYDHIYGCMQFYSGYLRSSELHHIINMMDVIVFDHAEDASHAADDAPLLAMVYIVAPYDVAADVLL